MKSLTKLDNIAITVHAHRILRILLNENPELEKMMRNSATSEIALRSVKNWALPKLKRLLIPFSQVKIYL
ncbi:MAG: hypothetical protein ACK5M7_18440 [Draconibacterium sp.]